jgi:flagellar motor switch protein FliN/FliY
MTDGNQTTAHQDGPGIDLLLDVSLEVSVELGRRRMTIADVLNLGAGSVVELSKPSGEALDIFVNDRLVARGEAVMVGERYGVRLTEVIGARGTVDPTPEEGEDQ